MSEPNSIVYDERRPRRLLASVLELPLSGLGVAYAGRPYLGLLMAALFAAVGALLTSLWELIDAPVEQLEGAFWIVLVGYKIVAITLASLVAKRSARAMRIAWILVFLPVMCLPAVGVWTAQALLGQDTWLGAATITGETMVPSLYPDDRIIYDQGVPLTDLRRGDIVLYSPPHQDEMRVGRLLAIGGDVIEADAHSLSLNGTPIGNRQCESGLDDALPSKFSNRAQGCRIEILPDGREYRTLRSVDFIDFPHGRTAVPIDHFFIVGDNRTASQDSRSRWLGPIPVQNYIGVFRGISRRAPDPKSTDLPREPDNHYGQW